jgi:hypothetical protein
MLVGSDQGKRGKLMSYGTGSMRGLSRGLTLLLAASLAACGGSKTEQAAAPPAAPPTDAAQQAVADAGAPAPLQASGMTWTPEQLEALAAPIALYPDPVLAQVFMAASNPQEVLDAGNWLLANESLTGKALDDAAAQVGFTPPVRGLIQFPQVIDLMCMQLDWTTELGQAFVDDQAGLLDAVQRLRAQAVDVGNLQSSSQMKVETEVQEGKEVITVSPPSPEVVYVPQYDPVAVYAPPAAAPAAATTTTTTTEKSGHSTGAMVTTGLLSFGAGLLVAEIFDDDDDYYHHNKNYYPNYGYGGMPYYPPYPYRPSYGNGFYPGNGYNRPPGYGGGNNTVIINQDNNYWNSYNRPGGNKPGVTTTRAKVPQSPITTAKKNRPELNTLNAEAKKGPKRKPPTQPDNWKGQSGYAGAKNNKAANTRVAANTPGTQSRPTTKAAPKVQGSYAGARDKAKPAAKPAARPAPAKPAASGTRDRGHATPTAKPASRPAQQPMSTAKPASPRPAAKPAARPTAVSGANRQGGNAKAASQRGKQSMPKGVPPKARAQKGGKKKAGR